MTTQPLPIQTGGDGIAPGVTVVRLEQPGRPVVVMDADLLDRLDATLDALPTDAVGVVIASASERAFVAGADLKLIMGMSDDELDAYLARGQRVLGRIASLPVPTAAAIAGAALGGGMELAMHCDALVAVPGAKPYPVGLPEAALGICPGWGGTNLLAARTHPGEGVRRTATGETMVFPQAVELGVFDVVGDEGDDAVALASKWASEATTLERDGAPSRWIGRDAGAVRDATESVRAELEGTATGRSTLACVDAGLDAGWQAALDEERQQLIALRATPDARERIEAFFARSKAKPGKA